jgi:TonB family protein
MRVFAPLTYGFLAFVAVSAACIAAAPGSATLGYQQRVNGIATQVIAQALAPHFAQLRGGTIKLIYRVGPQGKVQSVKIVATHPNRVITNACVNAIKAAQFPPIPQSVLKEQGQKWVDVNTEIGIDR